MSGQPQVSRSERAQEIFDEAADLNDLRDVVGHALSAADLGYTHLLQRVDTANEILEDTIGMGIILATNEAFEIDDAGEPHRIIAGDFMQLLGKIGLFKGLEVFDRDTLPEAEISTGERLEMCLVLAPDERNDERSVVKIKTLVPTSKTEGPVTLYESPCVSRLR